MKRLHSLEPNEVSLVPRGANKKKFLIFKSQKGKPMAKRQQQLADIANAVDSKTMNNIDKILKSMTKKMVGTESPGNKVGKDKGGDMLPKKVSASVAHKSKMPMGKGRNDGDHGAMHNDQEHGADMDHADVEMGADGGEAAPISDRAQAALKAVARILAPFKDELHDGHIDAVQNEIGIGGGGDGDGGEGEGEGKVAMSRAIPMEVEDEHHAAALEMAEKAYGAHLEKMGYRQQSDPSIDQTNATKARDGADDDEEEEEEEEPVGKVSKSAGLDLSAFPKEQRSQLELVFKAAADLTAANKELVQKNANLEKIVRAERDQRVRKEYVEKASAFKHLGANTEEVAEIMKSMSESDPDAAEKFESILKAANEQLRVAGQSGGGLYGEIGSRLEREGGNTPLAKIEALVEGRVQKSDGSKTREDIYADILRTPEGKRLYSEYKNGRPGGI